MKAFVNGNGEDGCRNRLDVRCRVCSLANTEAVRYEGKADRKVEMRLLIVCNRLDQVILGLILWYGILASE